MFGKKIAAISLSLFCIFSLILTMEAQKKAPASKMQDYIKWVEFNFSYPILKRAVELDIDSRNSENHVDAVEILAYIGAKNYGEVKKLNKKDVDKAYEEITDNNFTSPPKYSYYLESYSAIMEEYLGEYEKDGVIMYGIKVFNPVNGYYTHCDDFGNARDYGFKRKHQGHDFMANEGTQVRAMESGVVEALGWNRYGGWRIGIRSFDGKRYYYYAHLKKDTPYVKGLAEGHTVNAGELIGFVGRTGYSFKENVNNIKVPHLHFGIQLIFDESQKDGNNQIWINCYEISKLLQNPPMPVRVENP